MTILLDTHVLHWWATEPERLSSAGTRALESAEELAVAGVSWFELGWLIRHGRLTVKSPLRTWIETLARDVRTFALTPSIAATAAELPDAFPGDPIDRVIYATAVENGLRLVTRDRRMRAHDPAGAVVIW